MPELNGYVLKDVHVGENTIRYLWIRGIECMEHVCKFDPDDIGMTQKWIRPSSKQEWDPYTQTWTEIDY